MASPDIVIVLVGNKKDLEVCRISSRSSCARSSQWGLAHG
jgi:hypothetical protein